MESPEFVLQKQDCYWCLRKSSTCLLMTMYTVFCRCSGHLPSRQHNQQIDPLCMTPYSCVRTTFSIAMRDMHVIGTYLRILFALSNSCRWKYAARTWSTCYVALWNEAFPKLAVKVMILDQPLIPFTYCWTTISLSRRALTTIRHTSEFLDVARYYQDIVKMYTSHACFSSLTVVRLRSSLVYVCCPYSTLHLSVQSKASQLRCHSPAPQITWWGRRIRRCITYFPL